MAVQRRLAQPTSGSRSLALICEIGARSLQQIAHPVVIASVSAIAPATLVSGARPVRATEAAPEARGVAGAVPPERASRSAGGR